jgi:hypothetical protein
MKVCPNHITFPERFGKMTYPREKLAAFTKNYPRLASGLYQVFLVVVTFWCALAIARYGSDYANDDSTHGPTNTTNITVERVCRWGAREQDVDVGSMAVCSS